MSPREYELDPELSAKIILTSFENVENVPNLRTKIMAGQLDCCILKRALIVDPLQIIVCANKALLAEKYGHLTTKNVYTEMLFNLNLSKNITQSLIRFGIDDKDVNIIVAVICKTDAESKNENILSQVHGTQVPFESKVNVDEAAVRKLYRITDNESKVSSLVNSIISRIATKDFVSY